MRRLIVVQYPPRRKERVEGRKDKGEEGDKVKEGKGSSMTRASAGSMRYSGSTWQHLCQCTVLRLFVLIGTACADPFDGQRVTSPPLPLLTHHVQSTPALPCPVSSYSTLPYPFISLFCFFSLPPCTFLFFPFFFLFFLFSIYFPLLFHTYFSPKHGSSLKPKSDR